MTWLTPHTQDLWPPHDQPHGRTLITTRRRDNALTTHGCHLLDVDAYTLDEARTSSHVPWTKPGPPTPLLRSTPWPATWGTYPSR